jgi:hypothetical protein
MKILGVGMADRPTHDRTVAMQQIAVRLAEGVVDLAQDGHRRVGPIEAGPNTQRVEDEPQHARKALQLDAGDLDPEAIARMAEGKSGFLIPFIAFGLFNLLILIPTIAVSVRRIHDSGFSGWWYLLSLTGIGSIVMLIFGLMDGTPGPNRYGEDPKGRAAT